MEVLMSCSHGHCYWEPCLEILDGLVSETRPRYADLQQEETPKPPRQNLALCFGECFSTCYGRCKAV